MSPVLRHDAPFYARITENMSTGFLGSTIVGCAISTFTAVIWIIISFNSPTDMVTWGMWAWLGISLLIGSGFIMMDNANCKLHIDSTKSDLGKATAYYYLLNKDHQKMARPVLDKMAELHNTPSCPRGEIRKRYDRILGLYHKEQDQKKKNLLTDDLDLVTIDAYLDDESLNGGY